MGDHSQLMSERTFLRVEGFEIFKKRPDISILVACFLWTFLFSGVMGGGRGGGKSQKPQCPTVINCE